MQVKAQEAQDALIVTILDTRLDAKEAVDFKAKMVEYMNSGYHTIVLNCSAVRFMDSSGLGAIVSVLKLLGREGKLVLCGVTAPVVSLFQLTRMDKVFQMFANEQDALASLT
jgi:anti-sigma B factor antagonist